MLFIAIVVRARVDCGYWGCCSVEIIPLAAGGSWPAEPAKVFICGFIAMMFLFDPVFAVFV